MTQTTRKKYLPNHPLANKRGYVEVSRLVAMEMLGRSLLPNEIVTWKNGDRHDNRPENLEVVSRSKFKKRQGLNGSSNGSWKGGKTKRTDGYILVRCSDHPEALKTGYILEHRLVMEKKLGRRLKPGEVVHHINEKRNDNRPENLKLYEGRGLHLHEHGSDPSRRRRPGTPNPLIECACGCGRTRRKYDSQGRKRAFIHGHSGRGLQREATIEYPEMT